MTTTERDVVHEEIGGSVQVSREGYLRVRAPRGAPFFDVSLAEAEALARELRGAVFDNAPRMLRVTGYDAGDGVQAMEQWQHETAVAEGWDIEHGLQCPNPECGYVGWSDGSDAVFVVDEDERWSAASYERTDTRTGGPITETVATSGADTDYQGLGYRCVSCYHPVNLPDGVEEEWI